MNWQAEYSNKRLAELPDEDRAFYQRDLAIKRKHEMRQLRKQLREVLGMSLDDAAEILVPLLDAAKRRIRRRG